MVTAPPVHPDFVALEPSWELALRAEGFAENSVQTYLRGLRNLARWAAAERPGAGPADLETQDIRAWVVELRERGAASSARIHFTAARTFYAWALDEGEVDEDATNGITTPRAGEPVTPVLSQDELRRLLATCDGRGFIDRRDNAIIRVFVNAGLRLAENAALELDDVQLRERILYVKGKGSRRSGPRHRAISVGVRTMQAIDRYIRERRKQLYAEAESGLWLASAGGRKLSIPGIKTMISRRAGQAGLPDLHPHALRHTWAHEFRAAGGSEGDLMFLGGWRSRTQLDRYGSSAAGDRAREANRARSLGDKL
jgi:integrase/recombinase XerC